MYTHTHTVKLTYSSLWSWTLNVHTHTHHISTHMHTSLKAPRAAHKNTHVSNIWELESFSCSRCLPVCVMCVCVFTCAFDQLDPVTLQSHVNPYSHHTACVRVWLCTYTQHVHVKVWTCGDRRLDSVTCAANMLDWYRNHLLVIRLVYYKCSGKDKTENLQSVFFFIISGVTFSLFHGCKTSLKGALCSFGIN